MADYFTEKSHQIAPAEMVAFGIKISSRYGRADELIEMVRFSELVARDNLSELIQGVFYNSKMDMCTITLTDKSLDRDSLYAICDAADKTISQFDWFDDIRHGRPMYVDDIYISASTIRDHIMKTWHQDSLNTSNANDIAQSSAMVAIAWIMGTDFVDVSKFQSDVISHVIQEMEKEIYGN